MSIAGDIFRAWRHPRAVIAEKLAQGPREDRALAVLLGACGLMFVAQWPGLSRAAFLDPTTPLQARLSGALVACMFFLPLVAYGMAFCSHLAARVFGGRGNGFSARLSLFWAMLTASPAILLEGLLVGFVGQGARLFLAELMVFAGFLWLWLSMLVETERGDAG